MPTKFNFEDLWIVCFLVLCICILICSTTDLIKTLIKRKTMLNDLPFKGLGVKSQFDEKNISNDSGSFIPDNEWASWIEEGELDVELYMTEEQIGRLVKDYMVKTNGIPLQIVFPEYDRGE